MRLGARASDLTLIGIGLVTIVALTIASVVLAPVDSSPMNPGSSYASYRDGAKAAFLLLKDLGYPIQRSFEPFATLQADPERSTVVLAEPQRRPSRLDVAALRAFAESGGIVLATGASAIVFLPGMSERSARDTENRIDQRPRRYAPAVPSPLAQGAPYIAFIAVSPRLRLDPSWIPIYGSFDDPAVLSSRRGRGRFIWLASAEPLSNEKISSAGHVELFTNALGPRGERTILWDEYYHGHARSFWSYVSGTPLVWAGAQAAFIASLALVTFARRHGPSRPQLIEPRTSPLEFIDTVGALYERARISGAAVATARAHLRRVLLAKSGLPSSTSDESIVSSISGRYGITAETLRGLLEQSKAAEGRHIPERDALAIVKQLQQLAAQLAGARPALRGAPSLNEGPHRRP